MSIDLSEEGGQQDAMKALQTEATHLGNELAWWRAGTVYFAVISFIFAMAGLSVGRDLDLAREQFAKPPVTIRVEDAGVAFRTSFASFQYAGTEIMVIRADPFGVEVFGLPIQ